MDLHVLMMPEQVQVKLMPVRKCNITTATLVLSIMTSPHKAGLGKSAIPGMLFEVTFA
jgi:hypothetical protein